MKSGTQNHIKTKRLKLILGRPLYQIVGVLESLWLLAGECADDGCIGRFSREEVAGYMEWDGDTDQLIDGLTRAGFLDDDPDKGLVIHDWFDHCPYYIKQRRKKRKERDQTTYDESEGDTPETSAGVSGDLRTSLRQSDPTKPKPTQPKQSKAKQTKPSPTGESDSIRGDQINLGADVDDAQAEETFSERALTFTAAIRRKTGLGKSERDVDFIVLLGRLLADDMITEDVVMGAAQSVVTARNTTGCPNPMAYLTRCIQNALGTGKNEEEILADGTSKLQMLTRYAKSNRVKSKARPP